MNHVNSVSGRLSLRAPQRESLEILARVTDIVPPAKGGDVQQALGIIQSEFPAVTDFERDFPSLCFALATGVGKTRLMGAFISYLRLAHDMRHFFVLAPNLTIYNKLIADFTPGTPKYVLQGIAEFAQNPPEIITGDNYEGGRGVRGARSELFGERDVHINIFNISKINTEVRGGSTPRIKRLSEYIGESYFDYLAGLDDLVLLMDESHRYRASAGVRAINELRPVLGLELTATPQVEAGGCVERFHNVIYSYPLSRALADGFVKQPAVATRENFDAGAYSPEGLERLKLEDGARVHEAVRAGLETYALDHDVARVKPFMLVIARDTEHANALQKFVESEVFAGGAYAGRVITVHSKTSGEERDETVARLLRVESADEPTEIVIHVNMLKEGWDVTNLYTIVPLRAANARTLVEQSIGRGLRLPYGKRTGVRAVDRLTIIAHDRFQEIVDEANRPDSPIRVDTVIVGRDIPDRPEQAVVIPSNIELLLGGADRDGAAGARRLPGLALPAHSADPARSFERPPERAIARATLDAVARHEALPSSRDLLAPAIRAEIVSAVTAAMTPEQQSLEGMDDGVHVAAVVERALESYIEQTIDVPRIVIVPAGEVTVGFDHFDLVPPTWHPQPVAEAILLQSLMDNERERIAGSGGVVVAVRPEDHLVTALMDHPDVCYDDTAELLYHLAGQMVAYLRSYLPDEDAVDNVLRHHRARLADEIHRQLMAHRWERTAGYEARVSRGFTQLRQMGCTALAGTSARLFREPVEDRRDIRGMRFTGFRRCLYPEQRFDSDPERRFAVLLEDDDEVLRWFRPVRGQLNIYYSAEHAYEPDFIVETKTAKYLCEVKREGELDDPVVQAKAQAAAEWCAHATRHEERYGGKPWRYLLISESEIRGGRTLAALAAACTVSAAPAVSR